jgi:hypothetical protein
MQVRGEVVLALILTGALVASGFVASPASAAVLAASTFDSGTDGWTAIRIDIAGNALAGTVSFAAGAGNPGGALRHDAPSDSRTSYFAAPSSFVTALHSAIGGSISWDFSTINTPSDLFFSTDPDIDIRAGTTHIRRNVTSAPPISPTYVRNTLTFGTGDGWLFFDGANTTTATQPQIDAVLAAADSFMIRAEYWSSFTPDTTLLDNVVIAGPGVGAVLNRSTVAPGDVVEMRLFANPPLGPVDLYVVVALPLDLAPGLGCNSIPLAFLTNGGSVVTLSCLSNPPNTFPRFLASTTLSRASTLLSIVWSGAAPPGIYTFAAVATPPGALADGVLNLPTDIVGIGSAQLTVP